MNLTIAHSSSTSWQVISFPDIPNTTPPIEEEGLFFEHIEFAQDAFQNSDYPLLSNILDELIKLPGEESCEQTKEFKSVFYPLFKSLLLLIQSPQEAIAFTSDKLKNSDADELKLLIPIRGFARILTGDRDQGSVDLSQFCTANHEIFTPTEKIMIRLIERKVGCQLLPYQTHPKDQPLTQDDQIDEFLFNGDAKEALNLLNEDHLCTELLEKQIIALALDGQIEVSIDRTDSLFDLMEKNEEQLGTSAALLALVQENYELAIRLAKENFHIELIVIAHFLEKMSSSQSEADKLCLLSLKV